MESQLMNRFAMDDDEKCAPNLARREKKQTASFITVTVNGFPNGYTPRARVGIVLKQSSTFTQFSRNVFKQPFYHFQLIL
jgi:hypothetical protein